MRKVVIHTVEQVSMREATEFIVKIICSTYVKECHEHLATNKTQLNAEETTKVLGLLTDFEDLSNGTLWDWDTDPVYLELKTDYKPFNCKYYPVPRFNKETFRK